jgi:DNA-directed RNA polymerase II subunit RPB2
MTSGIVDKVIVTKNNDDLRRCKIRIFKNKIPEIGDKYASRCGQKGMCGLLLEQHQMPFTSDGIVPDLMINPHAIPSRMTINQLLEVVLGKSAVLSGHFGDATPFQNNNISVYSDILEKQNFERYGNEVMYSGITGEQLKTSIFIGPTYYQRLKIMVADKMFSRSTGPLQQLTRQPASGRGNEGGLRIGEMERDSILGHGVAGFLNESMMERSDKYKVQIDKYTGLISYDNNSITDKIIVEIPYSAKLLLQELETMSIAPRIVTPVDVSNPVIFEHLHDVYTSKM